MTGGATAPDDKPPSPYKGTMKVRAPLSTAQIDSAFQESRKPSLLEKAKRQLMDNTKDVRTAAGTMMSKTQGSLDGRREKVEKRVRAEYEKKRAAEIAAEMEERRREMAEAKRLKKQAR